MFSHLSPRQQFGAYGLVALTLFGFAYVGAQRLREPAQITYQPGKGQPEPASSPLASPRAGNDVVIHVAGAVKQPGVLHVPSGTRVEEAIRLAGGAQADADVDRLNLAKPVEDGARIFVPVREVAPLTAVPELSGPVATAPTSRPKHRRTSAKPTKPPKPTKPSLAPGSVSLNTAGQAQLESLPGVGPATAKLILEFRAAQGGFGAIDELLGVRGIGPKKLAKMRPYLRL